MLVLSRRAGTGEYILIGENIKVSVISVSATAARIGIQAPREIRVQRSELIGTEPQPKQRTTNEGQGES